MNNRKYNNGRRQTRLDRIERKCDRIISELAVIRQQLTYRTDDIDGAIERMHRNARRMRAEAHRNARFLHKVFHSKTLE
ncbi:hypothetical protein ED388_04800 [Muribaculaceae bacterium Isolate-007 (NCI)]|nr:hypothetical protein EEL42_03535 [Muribaculaceae bacterium Isolate-100 (HZI)]RXE66305.1 hypothetical protein ED388_04800 [Muribaculaceae bacterium Isolate-007 (NCI)]